MLEAEIVILTYKPRNPEPLTPSHIQASALHEIGHALGIVFHSDQGDDIMFCAAGAEVRPVLSYRDLNTLSLLYTGRKVMQQAVPNNNRIRPSSVPRAPVQRQQSPGVAPNYRQPSSRPFQVQERY